MAIEGDPPRQDDTALRTAQGEAQIRVGTRIGTYRIDAPLGAGGMGRVYRATDSKLNRPAAIKFLSEDLADAEARRRFQREAQMVSSLNHPHIVTVYDAGEYLGRQYLITELVDAGTLRTWATERVRGWRQIAELLVGVADGLATAHDAGILHRDVKPDNILIAKNGYAKLADFGIAKLVEGRESSANPAWSSQPTRLGMVLGTTAYMSPEQATGLPLDARSDVFSFGIVLYELLAGRRPFAADSEVMLVRDILNAAVPALGAEVPAELRAIVAKALEREPADRYQTMRDLVVDLRRLVRHSERDPAIAGPAAPERRRRLMTVKLGYAAAGLAVLALAWIAVRNAPDGAVATDAAVTPTLTSAAAPPISVAVLPFVSFGTDPEQEYFSDGISEELLNVLANVPGLRVPSRTSSFTFKGSSTDLRTIAATLNVGHVLEGSVRKAGNRVRITAQLIDVTTDSHLWSETYDRELTDVFAIQDEIAVSVAAALELTLLGVRASGDTGTRTASVEAYDAYLRGLAALATRRSEDILKARDLFQRAIDIDPGYAAAHARLAFTFFAAQTFGVLSPDEALPAAERAAARALALDPDLDEAYVARGQVFYGRGDYEAADADYRRGIELNPNSATAYGARVRALGELNRPGEARAALAKALELDPLNGFMTWQMGNVRLAEGNLAEASLYYRRGIELEPDQPNSYSGLGDVAIMMGRLDEGLLRYLEALDRDPGQGHMTACVGFIYLSLGDVERAQLWFDRAAELIQAGSLPRYYREFTTLVVRREDPEALLAVLRDVPAGQIFSGMGTRIFRKPALGTGDRAGIEAFYRHFWPELFADEPLVTVDNYGPASDVAWLMLGAGEPGRAERLLNAALEIHRDPAQRSMRPPDWAIHLVEVEALALQGRKAESLAALRRVIDAGWRWEWREVETDPTLASISAEPEFIAMIEEVKADAARQLVRVRALERDGTIPAPLPIAAAAAQE